MLGTLRRIVQEVAGAADLRQALEIAVRRVRRAMGADVCSVYYLDPAQGRFVLMASEGLAEAAVGRVALGPGEGLVSVVAETAEPLHLEDAHRHPRHRGLPGTGEERCRAFLGVPLIHHREVVGVLVVRRREARRFDEEQEAFLVTVAAQLAGAVAHAQAGEGLRARPGDGLPDGVMLEGVAGAPGVGIGTALVLYPPADLDAVPDRRTEDVEGELQAFREAVARVRAELEALGERIGRELSAEEQALFEAYVLMLRGEALVGRVEQRIREGQWASGALRDTVAEQARVFADMDDPYLRERAQDIRDLGQRILLCLQREGRRRPPPYPERTVLVGEEISAAMLAEVPRERLAGVVSVRGSRYSHVAILARALGVPAVVGVADLPVARTEGRELIVDGHRGRIYVGGGGAVRAEYARLAREEAALSADLEGLRALPAETPDGVRVPLYANTGLVADLSPSLRSGAEGIGLYRTEFPFLVRDRFPGEEEQRRVYRQVLEAFAPRPVILRTLDVGGDKALPYFPIEEDNPFLGWRGIRVTLDHPEIFLVQVRAMLRAAAGLGNLRLLLPMVSHLAEVDEARALVERAVRELQEAGEPVARPPLGAMVEVPSAVYQAEALARRVDFLSVGSNDLTQYLLAVDRNNARVAGLYDCLHPAVLRAVAQVVEGGHRQGREVGVCGEMAGDPAATVLLLGMGVDHLSMSVASLPRVKAAIRAVPRARARALLEEALGLEDPAQVRARVEAALEEAGVGRLVRSGRLAAPEPGRAALAQAPGRPEAPAEERPG
ncbi:MAG: phosphoenolpyruvate-protein phosphotransferase PtsP, partial [Gammaproteobacteria bacterium]